jgi:hypothetical protein
MDLSRDRLIPDPDGSRTSTKDFKDKPRITQDETKLMRHGGRKEQEEKLKYSGGTVNRQEVLGRTNRLLS